VSEPTQHRYSAFLVVLLVLGGLCGSIVLGTYLWFGTVEAFRTVTSLVMPLSLLWLFLLGQSVWRLHQRHWKSSLGYFAWFVGVTLAFNGPLSAKVISLVEWPRESVAPLREMRPFRAVIVLGGGVYLNPDATPELGRDGQRVFLAAQLWHAGLTETILCTGESAVTGDNQSDIARELLVSVKVPPSVIQQIDGENTTQEMMNLKHVLDQAGLANEGESTVGLITSAFHMRRALRLAVNHGLEFTPLPCAYRPSRQQGLRPEHVIPDLEAGVILRLVAKECLAYLVGR